MNAMPELIAYVDRFDVHAGDELPVRISTRAARVRPSLVRLGHTEPFRPAGFAAELPQDVPGRSQATRPGSFGLVPDAPALRSPRIAVGAWIYPTRLPADGVAGIVAKAPVGEPRGWALVLTAAGEPALVIAGETVLVGPALPALGAWYRVTASYDAASGAAALACHGPHVDWQLHETVAAGLALDSAAPVTLAAAACDPRDPRRTAVGCFNGKLEAPELRAGMSLDPDAAQLLAAWDLGAQPERDEILDRGPHGLHGTFVNLPTRAVTGRSWMHATAKRSDAPEQYAAVHFHDDDLGDAGWEADLVLRLPGDAPSGAYAVRLEGDDGAEDHVPFVVCPRPGAPTGDVLVVLPSLTYLAYANFGGDPEDAPIERPPGSQIASDHWERMMAAHPEHGLSLYDHHADGSGVSYSCWRRPILNLRATHRNRHLAGCPRHFAADLILLEWLDAKGIAYDVTTDDQLHRHGPSLLAGYRVVLTGSHPEYTSAAMWDAFDAHLDAGGDLLYLGGNGFYWVVTVSDDHSHIELRRGQAGSRTWESAPGELFHGMTGEPGGLWRHRGRAPNRLVGIGFTSIGMDTGRPYCRQAGSFDDECASFFAGVGADETIGDFGLALGAAASDEIDRFDPALSGTLDVKVLATADGFSDYYQLVVEDVPEMISATGGTSNARVRADMTYARRPSGGRVFATGSVGWIAALLHEGGENNVSRITENVVRAFLATDSDA